MKLQNIIKCLLFMHLLYPVNIRRNSGTK